MHTSMLRLAKLKTQHNIFFLNYKRLQWQKKKKKKNEKVFYTKLYKNLFTKILF